MIVHASGYGNVFFVATKAPQLKYTIRQPQPRSGQTTAGGIERDAYAVWNEWYAAAEGVAVFLRASSGAMEMALMEGAKEVDASRGQLLLDDLIRWSFTTPVIAKRIAAG